jgi:hypothetical protein
LFQWLVQSSGIIVDMGLWETAMNAVARIIPGEGKEGGEARSLQELDEGRQKELHKFRCQSLPPLPAAVVERTRSNPLYSDWFAGCGDLSDDTNIMNAGFWLLSMIKGGGFRRMPPFVIMEDSVRSMSGASRECVVAEVDTWMPESAVESVDLFREDTELKSWVGEVLASSRQQIAVHLERMGLETLPLFRKAILTNDGLPRRHVLESWTSARKFAEDWTPSGGGAGQIVLEAEVSPEAIWIIPGWAEAEVVLSPLHGESVHLVAICPWET